MSLKLLLTKLNPWAKKEGSEEPQVEEVEEVTPAPIEAKKPHRPQDKSWSMSELDKQLVVSLYATGLTPSEVIERARLEHNIEISVSQVHAYSKAEKWQPLIKKIREKHLDDISSVAGSHKKVRLQRGEQIYDKAIGKNKLDIALKAVESQRKEMEDGASVHLTLNQFNMLSDEELILKQKEALEKVQRLSQKKGVIIEQSANQTEAAGT